MSSEVDFLFEYYLLISIEMQILEECERKNLESNLKLVTKIKRTLKHIPP